MSQKLAPGFQDPEHGIGEMPTFTCCPGVLESRVYDQLGIPAVAFGPGVIERMHGPDEDVPITNLIDAAAIYTEVAGALAPG